MANKATFTAEEWTKLLESVMMAGIAVTAAEPSGLRGAPGFALSQDPQLGHSPGLSGQSYGPPTRP